MDDFLPWDAPPPSPSPIHEEPCLWRRESYDVTAVPAPEGVVLVRFNLNTDVCRSTDQLINIITYAIDIRTMRILSREMHARPNPISPQPPEAPSQPPGVAPPPAAALPSTGLGAAIANTARMKLPPPGDFRNVRWQALQKEATQVQFPLDFPKEERLIIPGTALKAAQLAVEHFLPSDVRPHRGATRDEVCLYQRESYDVTTAPGPAGVLFVRFTVKDGVCNSEGPVLDMGATYAIDVTLWRILAIQR